MSTAGPPKTAQLQSASGGSAAAVAADVGAHIRTAGPPQGANWLPRGAAQRRQPQAWGHTFEDADALHRS